MKLFLILFLLAYTFSLVFKYSNAMDNQELGSQITQYQKDPEFRISRTKFNIAMIIIPTLYLLIQSSKVKNLDIKDLMLSSTVLAAIYASYSELSRHWPRDEGAKVVKKISLAGFIMLFGLLLNENLHS